MCCNISTPKRKVHRLLATTVRLPATTSISTSASRERKNIYTQDGSEDMIFHYNIMMQRG